MGVPSRVESRVERCKQREGEELAHRTERRKADNVAQSSSSFLERKPDALCRNIISFACAADTFALFLAWHKFHLVIRTKDFGELA